MFGTVNDAKTGSPLSEVNIVINNGIYGTTTGDDGVFLIEIPEELPLEIEVSHIGYKTFRQSFDIINDSLEFNLYPQFIKMNQLVVTGTRTKKIHDDVPIATEVIDKDDIKNSGALNIADLLSQRAGVSLQRSVEGGSVLNILGMDSRYILVLMDGQPITGRFNNRVALEQILISRVKKVEIVKGPNSSLYGSEAMAGVINIITEDNNNLELIDITARYNNTENKFKNSKLENGSRNISFNGYKPFQKIKIKFNANFDLIKNDKSIQLIEIDKVNKKTLGGGIDWTPNNLHNFTFNIQKYDQYEIGESKLMNTNTKIIRNNFSLTHQTLNKKKWNLEQSINTSNYSRNYVQLRPWGDIEKDDTTNEDYIEYELLLNKKFGLNELTAGLETYNANYKSDRVLSGKQEMKNYSIFSQYDFIFFNNLNAIFGLRLDDYSEYNSVISPRLGLMYKFRENWKFRTSWGKGFRAPSFMEKYIDWNHVQFNYTVIGNPNLQPEQSEGVTFGFEYVKPSNYQMSLMFYQTKFQNLVEDFTIKPGLLSYQNIEKATFSGLELMGKWKFSDQINTKWGINWVNNRDGNNKIIPNTIPLSITSTANYNHPKKFFYLSINTKWIASYRPQEYDPLKGLYIFSEEKLESYTLIMLKTSIKINSIYDISMGVDNANNYTNNRYGPFVGRSAYLEVSTKLKGGEK
jgi:outer membrane receptor for ferrienterochelin and colicins